MIQQSRTLYCKMNNVNMPKKDERGMVSILVTIIMLSVITLIVIGFAEGARRDQRQALDNQLSTQAYYAAESGVNAAIHYLTDPANKGSDVNTFGNCTSFIHTLDNTTIGASTTVNILDTPSNTAYTCLMVNTEPSTLSVAPLTQNNSQILYFANTDNEPFTQLKFLWTAQANSPYSLSACTGSAANGITLPSYDQWNCAFGILRMDITDITNVSNVSLSSDQAVMSFYLIPSYNSGSPFVSAANISWPPKTQPVDPLASNNPTCNASNGDCPVQIIPVSCTSSGCSLLLNIAGGSTQYYARLTMMYQDAGKLSVAGGDVTHAINPATSAGASFVGGQALIDSTGQAGDELRRVQVRIPINTSSGIFPAYALQTTQSICKQTKDGPSLYTDNCPNDP